LRWGQEMLKYISMPEKIDKLHLIVKAGCSYE